MTKLIIILINFLIVIPAHICSSPLKHYGIRVGYTSARQIWKNDLVHQDDISWRSGVNVGVFTEWFNYDGLSLIIEIKYEQKGMGYSNYITNPFGQISSSPVTYYSRLDYISVPFLAKYTFKGDPISSYVLFGPRLDYLADYAEGPDHLTWGIEDHFNDLVYGLTVGFGIQNHNILSRVLSLDITYNHDLKKLYEFTNLLSGNQQSIKNETFNISIGIEI